MIRVLLHGFANPRYSFLRPTKMAQQAPPIESIKRVVEVDSDAPVGVKFCTVVLSQLHINGAQYPMTAAVIFVQFEGSACKGKCGLKLPGSSTIQPLNIDCQGEVSVTHGILGVYLDSFLKQSEGFRIVLLSFEVQLFQATQYV